MDLLRTEQGLEHGADVKVPVEGGGIEAQLCVESGVLSAKKLPNVGLKRLGGDVEPSECCPMAKRQEMAMGRCQCAVEQGGIPPGAPRRPGGATTVRRGMTDVGNAVCGRGEARAVGNGMVCSHTLWT